MAYSISDIGEAFDKIDDLANKIGDTKDFLINKITDTKDDLINKIGDTKDDLINKIGDTKDFLNDKITDITNTINDMKDIGIENIADFGGTAFKSVGGKAYEVGSSGVTGLTNEMTKPGSSGSTKESGAMGSTKESTICMAGSNTTSFIPTTKAQGWLSAGSYFFDLVDLNGSATSRSDTTDTNSGLEGSGFGASWLYTGYSKNSTECDKTHFRLCQWLGVASYTRMQFDIGNLITGSASVPTIPPTTKAVSGSAASTVYGFVTNSLILQLPGQPSLAGPKIDVNIFPEFQSSSLTMPDFGTPPCGGITLFGQEICIGQAIGTMFFEVLAMISNVFINILGVWINNIIVTIISVPLAALQTTFQTGVQYLTENPGSNPIVTLAQMGVYYINLPANLYVAMITMEIAVNQLPFFGQIIGGFLFMLLVLASPLILAWMGVMFAIGITTAFYIPFLPYMIFTFGVIAWLTAVIEAMVAAPIVALAITHPEGEGILGSKGEHALLILMNVFLRPAMMIIGFIAAIALCYVSVWIINSGFANVLSFINGDDYTGWAGLYVLFFSVVIYTTMYVTVAQKAFNLIYLLPDKVLRWIGGQDEHIGQESAGWSGEVQKQVDKGGEASEKGSQAVMEKTIGAAKKLKDLASSSSSGDATAQASGDDGSTPGAGGAGAGGA